jgi:hypothetical protein
MIEGVATYHLDEGGRSVTVDPSKDAAPASVRVFLLGTVFGLICHARGLLPLHGSCVQVGSGAIALCGPRRAGKSTTAAALVERGHGLLADDVCVIDARIGSTPLVLPAFPRMKLSIDAMREFGIDSQGLERTLLHADKYLVPAGPAFVQEPLPLRAVYHLERADTARDIDVARLRGLPAVQRMLEVVFRRELGWQLRGQAPVIDAAARVAEAVPAYVVSYPTGLARLDALVDVLVRGAHDGSLL